MPSSARPLIDAGSIDESMTARPHANVLRLVVAGTNERSGPHMHYPGQTGQNGVERHPFVLAGVGRQPVGARTRTHTRPGRARWGFARFFVSRPSRYRHLKTQPDTQAAIQSARKVSTSKCGAVRDSPSSNENGGLVVRKKKASLLPLLLLLQASSTATSSEPALGRPVLAGYYQYAPDTSTASGVREQTNKQTNKQTNAPGWADAGRVGAGGPGAAQGTGNSAPFAR